MSRRHRRHVPPVGRRTAAAVLGVLAVVTALTACESERYGGSDTTVHRPSTTSSTTAAPVEQRRPLEGFDEVGFSITSAVGEVLELCALLADDAESRGKGMMEQEDLRGYDGMIFAFDEPTEGDFYMRNTPLPLSIAWFAEDGSFVSSADMEPCEDRPGCPTYGADGPYLHALEVEQGDLPALGVGEGSTLAVGGPCPAPG